MQPSVVLVRGFVNKVEVAAYEPRAWAVGTNSAQLQEEGTALSALIVGVTP